MLPILLYFIIRFTCAQVFFSEIVFDCEEVYLCPCVFSFFSVKLFLTVRLRETRNRGN